MSEFKLSDFVETLGGIYIQSEALKTQEEIAKSNAPTDHPYVETGVDSNGDTLLSSQIIKGVDNGHLFGGLLVLSIVGLGVAVALND